MAEFLHPGLYMRERTSGVQPIQGVSTSTMGIVGFTSKGPTDKATLVTSFPAFERKFGGFTAKSQLPTHVYAFFANGGRRAYVVRVVPSDAIVADGWIRSVHSEEQIGVGDGVIKIFSGTLGHPPVERLAVAPGVVEIEYPIPGTPVATENTNALPAPDGVELNFTGRMGTGVPIIPGTVVLHTLVATVDTQYNDAAVAGELQDAGGAVRGYIDYKTGHFNLSTAAAAVPDNLSTIDADYTPVGASVVITDDPTPVPPANGLLVNAVLDPLATNDINYTTGDWQFTVDVVPPAPANGQPIIARYTQLLWNIDPISAGEWGNDLRIDVRGDDDFFDRATASFSRCDVLIYLRDENGVYQLQNQAITDLSFTDPTDVRYVASVINAEGVGSDLITLQEPSSADEIPRSLNGYIRTRGVGAGNGLRSEYGSTDGTGGTPTIPLGVRSMPFEGPVQPASIIITATSVLGATMTVRDDGDGNLIGDIDPASPANFNVVDYDTGEFAVRFVANVIEAETSHILVPTGLHPESLISALHYRTPADTTEQNVCVGGSDGTAITRNELTNPTLKTARRGMYALLPTNEIINLVIPDAAGNVTMSLDQTTEAEENLRWFVILATPQGYDPQQARDYRINKLGYVGNYAALYWPWITITDPITNLPKDVPPQGHIAGVYARTDATKSVGKAPAGVVDGRLNFSIGLEYTAEFAELDILHPKQIDSLIDTEQTGRCVWGARTLESPPSDFRYIHARRLFIFLREAIYNSSHGFVFENTGEALWSRIRISVESFLLLQYGQGLFAGKTPRQAFYVVCDETINPPEVQDQGIVYCDVYVAVNKPGEFIQFTLQQIVTQSGA